MQFSRSLAALVFAGCTSMCASAGVTTVGFVGAEALRDPTQLGLITRNYEEGGYRFSPACHIDWFEQPNTGPAFPDNAGIGWDDSGCGTYFNNNYLGTAGSNRLRIDRSGAVFDVLSVAGLSFDFMPTSVLFYSSKGGVANVDAPAFVLGTTMFSGDLWKGVEWIEIQGGGGAPHWLMDSITFSSVPEPGPLALVAVAAFAACRAGRRKT